MSSWKPLIAGSCALIFACSTADTPSTAEPGTDAGGGEVRIDSVNTMRAAPMSLVALSGSGFAATGTLWVRFLDARGYAVAVPAVRATPTRVTAVVPPYIDVAAGAIGHATVGLDMSADPKDRVR